MVVAAAGARRRWRAWRSAAALAWLALGAPATSAALELREHEPHANLSGSLAAWNVFRLDPDTPSERPSSTLDLRFQADHARRLYFTLATRLGYDGKIGNPDRGNPILDLDDYHQDKDLFVTSTKRTSTWSSATSSSGSASRRSPGGGSTSCSRPTTSIPRT